MIFTWFLPLILLIIGLFLGVPVAYTMLIAGSLGLILEIGLNPAVSSVQSGLYTGAVSFLFAAIPMFVLMATIMEESKLTEDLFRVAEQWMGKYPSGLPIATTLANGGMAVLSGSSTASAAAMSKIAVPEMRKQGYNVRISMGTVSAAGTFASMLPPSIALIVYGLISQTSITDLFMAGIVPGILTIIGYIVIILVWVRKEPPETMSSQKRTRSWEERLAGLKSIWGAFAIGIIVLGGIYSGIITPTEAGGVGAASALLVGVLSGMSWRDIDAALESAVEITAMIFMIFIGATVFGQYLSVTRATSRVVDVVTGLPLSVWMTLLIILGLYIFLGALMDQIAILLMTVPITYPLVITHFGFDPVWFGVVLIKTVEIGLVTPPFGLNVFIASGAVGEDTAEAFRGAMPFLVADVAVLGIMLAFPETVLWLPS